MKLLGSMEVIDNNLYIGRNNTLDLVKEYGTPLYVIDEEYIRSNCRRYYKAFKVEEHGNKVAYAGKAFLTLAMCQIIKEEGLNLDVVSGGELYTAYKSDFPMERIYFHGNNKTYEEIAMGINLGVGRFVVDNLLELNIINDLAEKQGRAQDVLLRITPGIEAHTHSYIKTGQVDSKFGFTILENNAIDAIKKALELPNINLVGLHCHIGSQIFETKAYEEAADIMINLVKNIKEELNYTILELNLGGGFGIYYKEGDTPKTIESFCEVILNRVYRTSKSLEVEIPKLVIEPGRSIVGNAGITLYTIGAMKEIPNVRKYVSVDGGMTDNIRPSLYNAEYECLIANKAQSTYNEQVTISGKCCESGDVLMSDVKIPQVEQGDILVVLSTGAYCYAMSSNYNKIPKAPVVAVKNRTSRLICRRETYEDIIRNELAL